MQVHVHVHVIMELDVFGGLITPAHCLVLSLE